MLVKIDAWEKNNKPVFVILAKIVQMAEKNNKSNKAPDNWKHLKAYNKEVEKLLSSRSGSDNISLVDMSGVQVGKDGCHPSQAGYKTMADRWFKAIKEILDAKPEPGVIKIIFETADKEPDYQCKVKTITKTKKSGQKVEIILPTEHIPIDPNKDKCDGLEVGFYRIPNDSKQYSPGEIIYVDRSMTIDVFWMEW